MYCINSGMWDNGRHLLTFYLLVETFDLASAVLLGANALRAPMSPPLQKQPELFEVVNSTQIVTFLVFPLSEKKEKTMGRKLSPTKENGLWKAWKFRSLKPAS